MAWLSTGSAKGSCAGVDALVPIPGVLTTSGAALSETQLSTPTLNDTDPLLVGLSTSMSIGSVGDGDRGPTSPGVAATGNLSVNGRAVGAGRVAGVA